MTYRFFVTAPRGLEAEHEAELRSLAPAVELEIKKGGIGFIGDLEAAYRIGIWSRVSSQLLLHLGTFEAKDPDALYEGIRQIPWQAHLNPRRTLAVRSSTSRSSMTNGRFISLKVKDGIVDTLRDATGSRPDIDTRTPDIQVRVRVAQDQVTVSLELSARPGTRTDHVTGQTPPRGELAAGILLKLGWPELAASGAPLVDPLCGSSGAFLVEAATIAMDVAPGLLRDHGLKAWRQHDHRLWRTLLEEARGRQRSVTEASVIGLDPSKEAILELRKKLETLGVPRGAIRTKHQPLSDLKPPTSQHLEIPPGLVVANPPYGDLETAGEQGAVVQTLGDLLKLRFSGWTAALLMGNPAMAKRVGLKAAQRVPVWSGATECRVLVYPLHGGPSTGEGPQWRKPSPDSAMLVNRLRKNLKKLRKWSSRNEIFCYRVYDADIPEYNMAIDWYDGMALIQEYQRPWKVDPRVADKRLQDAAMLVPEILGIDAKNVAVRIRQRQREGNQYQKRGDSGGLKPVREGGLSLLINLHDYLDTGLFLDQRKIRTRLRELAKGKAFVNLFAYTCTATAFAAAGGATKTTSVDLSRTYLDWGKRNLSRNGFEPGINHRFISDDCMAWLRRADPESAGLIYAAPPIFSRSKRAETFDVQRDHEDLIKASARLLTPDGVLIFSNPYQGFKLNKSAFEGLEITLMKALPKDFERNPNIFSAWSIRKKT